MLVQCTCRQCGRSFSVRAAAIAQGRGRHCSRTCAGLARRLQVEQMCAGCGVTFFTIPARLAAGRGVYCSKRCSIGAAVASYRAACAARRVARLCARCGKAFTVSPGTLAVGRGHFCSRACAQSPEALEQRVWRQVAYGGPGCWEWTGYLDPDGYGRITIGTKANHQSVQVARIVWKLIHGGYPRMACHHCDNRACVRPSHIYDGTPLSNMRDRSERGRARGAWGGVHGDKSPMAKLTAADIPTIRKRRAAGETYKRIAADYGVALGAIHAVTSGKTWRRTP